MNVYLLSFDIMMRQIVEATNTTWSFVLAYVGAENVKIIALSAICFIIGIWIGKKITDRKWIFNALESYPLEYDGWFYKVEKEERPDEDDEDFL